jgi:cytidyltransferase-like protein
MILGFGDLAQHRRQVVMVDGCFDPLHRGHVEYFAAAAQLGSPVLCNIAPDSYLRTKHPPLLPQSDRAVVIDSIRYISFTHPSDASTADVLRELQPLAYVKGADWAGSIPAEQAAIVEQLGIEIVLLDTVRDSSGKILRRYVDSLALQ